MRSVQSNQEIIEKYFILLSVGFEVGHVCSKSALRKHCFQIF